MSSAAVPLLSLVIPHRNHQRHLPSLLDSVLAQSLRSLEVIVVDDASDASCEDIIQAYAGKGLDIRLLQNPVRIFTLLARLRGIEAARGQIIAFADADDLLWGTTALEDHARLLLSEDADIVHFNYVFIDNQGAFRGEPLFGRPFAARCEGKDIFTGFIGSNPWGGSVCNKLFRKSLCLLCREDFERSAVTSYAEDYFMNVLLMFHARRYAGSKLVGYGYRYVDKRSAYSLPYSLGLWAMGRELMPLLRKKGASEASLQTLAVRLQHLLRICAGRMCLSLVEQHGNDLSDEGLATLLRHADAQTWLRILVAANKLHAEKLQHVANMIMNE